MVVDEHRERCASGTLFDETKTMSVFPAGVCEEVECREELEVLKEAALLVRHRDRKGDVHVHGSGCIGWDMASSGMFVSEVVRLDIFSAVTSTDLPLSLISIRREEPLGGFLEFCSNDWKPLSSGIGINDGVAA